MNLELFVGIVQLQTIHSLVIKEVGNENRGRIDILSSMFRGLTYVGRDYWLVRSLC